MPVEVELPRFVLLRMRRNPRGNTAVMKPLFAPDLRPENGHLLRSCNVRGDCSPVNIRQPVSRHIPVRRVEILGEMIPYPEFRHKMMLNSPAKAIIPFAR